MYSPYNKEYEQKITDNLRHRAKLLMEAEKDPKLQACIIQKCKDDPKYFFNNFLYTVKNPLFFTDEMPQNIPFMLFEYQEELVETLWNGILNKDNVFLEKSRQMSVTWIVMGLFVYGFLFYNHRYLIISRTAGEVDTKGDINSCFERLRYMVGLLPKWLLPEKFDKTSGGEHNKYMAIVHPKNPASITGESASANAGRGGTYTAIFMDEMAFMQDATSINGACSSATSCRIINSTPNGE